MKTVVLLSGGLDSATAAAEAKMQGFELYALSINYNQRHSKELLCAEALSTSLGVTAHHIVQLDMPALPSALTNQTIPVPEDDFHNDGIPITYVPSRNIIFLSLAASFAEAIGARDIFAGFNAVDYSGYPDCRTEFVESFQTTLNIGTKAGVEGKPFHIHAPLMGLTKADIIRRGMQLNVDYSLTWSCYKGEVRSCGHCDSCFLRLKGFREAGLVDPIEYEA